MSQPVGPSVISALFRPQTQRFPQADNALGGNQYSPTARETREIWPYISGTRISVDPNTEGCRTSDTRRNIETQLLYINRLSDGDPVAK